MKEASKFTSFSICQDDITSFFLQGGTAKVKPVSFLTEDLVINLLQFCQLFAITLRILIYDCILVSNPLPVCDF